MGRFLVLGVSDDRDLCECCGKQGLKKVVFIQDTETQDIKHFGTTCATRPAAGFGPIANDVKTAISDFEFLQSCICRKAHKAYLAAGGKYSPVDKDGCFKRLDPELYVRIKAEVAPIVTAEVSRLNGQMKLFSTEIMAQA